MDNFSPLSQAEAFYQESAQPAESGRSIFSRAQAEPPKPVTPDTVQAFTNAAIKYNVPADVLLGLAEKDSGFDTYSRSRGPGAKTRGIINIDDEQVQRDGINPYLPEQAIESTAKKIRGFLDQGLSLEDAIKAHAAGGPDGVKDPKAADYAADVLARAPRLADTYYPKQAAQPAPAPETAPQPPRERPGYGEQFSNDVSRGFSNLKNIGIGLGGLVADAAGFDGYAKELLNSYVQNEKQLAKDNPATVGSYANIKSLDDAGRYAVEAVGENVAMFVPSLITGGVGAAVGRKIAQRGVQALIEDQVAKGVARDVAEQNAAQFVSRQITKGAVAGAAPSAMGMEAGSIEGDIYEKTGESRPGLAAAAGVAAGALDMVEPVLALRKVVGAGLTKELTGSLVKRLGVEGAKQFAVEAGTEGLQTIIENYAALQAQNKDTASAELFDGVIDSMLKGGIGGGVMGVASQSVEEAPDAIGRARAPFAAGRALAQTAGAPRDPSAMGGASAPSQAPAAPAPAPTGPLSGVLAATAPHVAPLAGIAGKRVTLSDEMGDITGAVISQDANGILFKTDDGLEMLISNESVTSGKVALTPMETNAHTAPTAVRQQPLPDDMSGQRVVVTHESGTEIGTIVKDRGDAFRFVSDQGLDFIITRREIDDGMVGVQFISAPRAAPKAAPESEVAPETVAPPAPAAPAAPESAPPPAQQQLTDEQYADLMGAPAKEPSAPVTPPVRKPLKELTEPELRTRLKDLAAQAKAAGGWKGPLNKERARIEQAINALAKQPEAKENLADVGKAGAAINEKMHEALWKKIEAGETIENGSPSPFLQAAKILRDNGGMTTPEEARALANDYGKIERGPTFQDDMNALVRKHWPKAPQAAVSSENEGGSVSPPLPAAPVVSNEPAPGATQTALPVTGETQAPAEANDDVANYTDEALRHRLKFIAEQTKKEGASAPLIKWRKEIEAEIDRRRKEKAAAGTVSTTGKPKKAPPEQRRFDTVSKAGPVFATKNEFETGYNVSWASTHLADAATMEEAAAIAEAVAKSGADNISDMRKAAKEAAAPAQHDVGDRVNFRLPYVNGKGEASTKGMTGIVQREEGGKLVVRGQDGGIYRKDASELTNAGAVPGEKERIQRADALYEQSKAKEKTGQKSATAPAPLPTATAPEHVERGVDDRELSTIVGEFNDAQASMFQDEEQVTHVFDPPAKGAVVRLEEKVRVYTKEHGWMTPAEAKARIAEWKANAAAQGEDRSNGNNKRVVLSLFDLTGKWSQPWEDAGYQVWRFDIQNDPENIAANEKMGDVNNFSTEFFGDWFGDFDGQDIYAILAACPCTDFASSGARHFAAKDADGRTVASVKLVHQTLAAIEYFKPAVWAIENPVGRIEKLGGLPPWRLSFDPNHIGEDYTKKTLLWGRFNADLPIAPTEPTAGSKMHSQFGGKSMATKNARSATPEGFAYAFFQANNAVDHLAMAIANKFDRLDRSLIEQAIAAGVTEDEITTAVEDFYYQDLDNNAANEAIKDLIAKKSAPTPTAKPAKGKRNAQRRETKKANAKTPEAAPETVAPPVEDDRERKRQENIAKIDAIGAEWWDKELTGSGRREAAETAGVKISNDRVQWERLPQETKTALERVRLSDSNPAAPKVEISEPTGPAPQWAQNHAEDIGGDVIWHDGEVALIRGYNRLNGRPAYSGANERARTRVDITAYTGNLFTNRQRERLIAARAKAVAKDKAANAANPDGPFKDGKRVAASPNFPPKLAAFAEGLLNMLGIKARVYLTTMGDARAVRFNGPFAAINSAGLNGNDRGVARKLSNGDYYVGLKLNARVVANLETIAHEIGHILEREVFETADGETKSAIRAAYDKWAKANGKLPIGEVIHNLRARITAKQTRLVGSEMTKAEDLDPYWLSFSEWFADNVSRWAVSSEKPLTLVDQFFDRIGKALRRIYAAISGRKYLPADEMARWLDARGPSMIEPVPTPEPVGKPADSANTTFTDDEFEKARARFLDRQRSKARKMSDSIEPSEDMDPEDLIDGIKMAGWVVEKGNGSFASYAATLLDMVGEEVRPYLQSWYLALKFDPKGRRFAAKMTGAAEVEAFDVATVGKEPVNEPAKLDQSGAGTLEGISANEVQGASTGGDAGTGAETGGGTDLFGANPVGGKRNGSAGRVGNGARTVSVPAGGAEPQGSERQGAGGERGGENVQRNRQLQESGNASVSDRGGGLSNEPASGHKAADAGSDFAITDEDRIGEGGKKTKFRNNVEAIRIVKRLAETQEAPSAADQKALAKWVGWGGLPEAFERSDGAISKGWEKEAKELKELLTPAEYAEAAESTQYAHYTAPEIVKAMWDAMRRLGFNGGRVLEPGVGAGNFIGLMPKDLRAATALHGVEKDIITGGVAKGLYPSAKITLADFRDYTIPEGYFDAAIGNPPFASTKIKDTINRDISGFSLHNYFFAKTLNGLKPGGVMAMVVTSRMMDSISDTSRAYMANRADLVAAIRLPNNAFLKNAGTQVTTDIIILRKRKEGEAASGETWGKVADYTNEKGQTVPLNEYFIRHPENMLGEFGPFGSMYSPDEPALVAREGQDTPALLREAMNRLPENITSGAAIELAPETPIPATAVQHVRVGSLFMHDGKVMLREPDSLGETRATEAVFPNEKAKERIIGMIGVRDAFARLRAAQLNPEATDKEIEAARADLNKVYDAFVRKNGFINQEANRKLFREDPSWPQIAALEEDFSKGVSAAVAKSTGQPASQPSAKKAAIFIKRTQSPYAPPRSASSAKDALLASLSERGRVDLLLMEKLYGKDSETILADLGNLVFEDPVSGVVTREEYLSGNVKKKLAEAQAAAEADPAFKRNVEALRAVQPRDVEPVDIDVKIGSHWVPESVMTDFAIQTLGTVRKVRAIYNAAVSSWSISGDSLPEAQTKWGTDRVSVTAIIEAAANQKAITVRDRMNDGSSVVNDVATQAANDKVQAVKDEWRRWVFEDDARRETLARLYNDVFNTTVNRDFDGAHLTFPGKVGDDVIRLRPHQANAVWRALQNATTLFDHVVGAGKTFTMVATAMEMRRMGLAKKPMFVVPNHLVGQWGADFVKLYPNANVLAATKKDFEKENRKRLFARIATGDWDAVIVAHSSFSKVEVDPEAQSIFIEKQVADLLRTEENMRAVEGKDGRNVKQVQKRIAILREKQKRLLDTGRKDDSLYWHELGVDALFLDEAHEFKNLEFSSSMQRVAGLGNQSGSQKASDLYLKVDQVLEATGGRNIVFATGTPISNTMAEMFTMQRYLDGKTLAEQGLNHFDAWARVFGDVVTDWELSPSGSYKLNSRFAKFVNMPELMQRYTSFADVINRDDINAQLKARGETLPVPKIKGGKPQNIVVDRSQNQAAFIGEPTTDANGNESYPNGSLVWRAENLPKKAQKGADNMLKIMSDARKAALDMRLINPAYPDNPGSKINVAADRIKALYDKWNADKGTQLVFIDLSTPKAAAAKERKDLEDLIAKAENGDKDAQEKLDKISPDEFLALESKFSVYDDLRDKLIARGIPENEIAFIHSANTEAQKEQLFGKVKSGRIRVLFGSTPKMGAGMNVQERLVALHHLDAPWRPSDLEQREGRIIRQGNVLRDRDPEGFEIEINRYATKATLDSRMWQTIEGKARFIEQVRKGNEGSREIEDVAGEAANAAEMKAAASGNPLVLEEMTLRQRVKKLENEQRAHQQEQWGIKANIRLAETAISTNEASLTMRKADAKVDVPEEFAMAIRGKTFDKRKDAGFAILKEAEALKKSKGERAQIGAYGGFKIFLNHAPGTEDFSLTVKGTGEYRTSLFNTASDAQAIAQRIVAEVRDIRDFERFQKRIDDNKATLAKLQEQIRPWPKAEELTETKARHSAVIAELKPKKKEAPAPEEEVKASIADQKPVAVLTGKELMEFKGGADMPALRKAATAWYSQNLRGTTATMADGTVVKFGLKGQGKATSGGKGDVLLRAVPAIKSIIENGRVALREPGNKDHIIERMVIAAPVSFEGRIVNLAVSVHKQADGNWHYDLTRDIEDGAAGVPVPSRGNDVRTSLGSLDANASDLNIAFWEPVGNGMSQAALGSTLTGGVLGPVVKLMMAAGRIRLHDTAETIPGAAGREGVQAVVTPDGVIHMVAGNLDASTARGVLLHEAFHSGGEALVGSPAWKMLLNRVGASRSPFFAEARARAEAAGTTPEHMNEEIAAYAIENRENAPVGIREAVDNFLGKFKAWALKRFGVQFGDVTPGQLRSLAVAALRSWRDESNPATTSGGERFSVEDAQSGEEGGYLGDVQRAAIDDILAGKKRDAPVVFQKVPLVLEALGVKQTPVAVAQSVIWKANADKHGMTPDKIKAALNGIANPVMVFDSATTPGSFIILVDVPGESRPVVVAAHPDEKIGRIEITRIASIHRKDSGQSVIKWWNDGLTRYFNKTKAGEWVRSRGLYLPKDGSPKHRLGIKILQHSDVFNRGSGPRYSIASTARAALTPAAGKTLFQAAKDRASDWLTDAMVGKGTAVGDVSSLGLVPVRPLFMELSEGMPSAKAYMAAKDAMDAFRNELNGAADALLQKWTGWARKAKDMNEQLMEVMHRSTLAEYDPTLTDREAIGRGQKPDPAVKRLYEALSPEAKDLYVKVRDAYAERGAAVEKQIIENVKKALEFTVRKAERKHAAELERIDDEGLTGDERTKAIRAADRKLLEAKTRLSRNRAARLLRMRQYFEKNKINGPYFPLARFGNYLVTLRSEDGKVLSFEKYETKAQQRARVEELRAEYGHDAVEEGVAGAKSKDQTLDHTFVAAVDQILDDADVDYAVRDQVYQAFLETMPDLSMRKAQLHRKGTPGFSADAVRAFASNMFHSAHQLSRLRHNMEMQDHLAEASKQARNAPDPVRAQAVYNEMVKAHDFAMNPQTSALSHRVTSAVFLWTMAFNASTAMVNVLQTATGGIPNIAYDKELKVGPRAAGRELAKATTDFLRGKGWAEEASTLSADERAAMRHGYESGLIDSTQAHDVAGIAESGIDYNPTKQRVMRAASAFMHHTERLNREVTYLAAYRLAREKGMTHEAALKKAADLTWMTHFDNQSNAKPRFMRSDKGKIVFALKTYQANMVYRIFRDLHQAMHGLDPETRQTAFKRFTASFLLTAGVAGVRGAFFYNTIMLLAGAFMGLLGDDDDPDEKLRKLVLEGLGDSLVGRAVGGVLLDGLPGYVTGTSITGRVGMADVWFRSNDRDMSPEQAWLYWLEQAGGAGVGLAHQAYRGVNDIREGNVERGMEKLAPAAVRNILKAGRYASEGVLDKNGNPIVEKVPMRDAIKQAIGFTPAEIADRYARNTYENNRQRNILDQATKARTGAARAILAGDEAATEKAMKAVDVFNEKYPEVAIGGKSIMQSLRNMENRRDRVEFGVDLNPKLSERIKEGTAPSIYSR